MIVDNLIIFLYQPISFLIGLLPNADVDILGIIDSQLSVFRIALTNIGWFFPVNTALTFLSIVFTIEAVLLVWKGARYIIGLFTFGVTK